MALTFYWRCEGTTLDGTHDFTAGDSTATLNSAAAINTAAVRYGTNGLDCPTSSDNATFTVSTNDLANPAAGAMAAWVRITTWGSAATLLSATGSTGNDFYVLMMTGTDELRFSSKRNGGSTFNLDTTAANLATGNWYFVGFAWDQAANDRRIVVYDSNMSLIENRTDLTTAYDQPTDIISLRIGEGNVTASDTHIDNVFVGSAYADLDDFITNATITSYTSYTTGGGGGGEVSATPMHRPGRTFGPAAAARLGGILHRQWIPYRGLLTPRYAF